MKKIKTNIKHVNIYLELNLSPINNFLAEKLSLEAKNSHSIVKHNKNLFSAQKN